MSNKWRNQLGKAQKLFVRAKEVAEKENPTADEMKSVNGWIEEAKALRESAQQLQIILSEGETLLAMENKAVAEEELENKKEIIRPKKWETWGEFLLSVFTGSAIQKGAVDPRLEWKSFDGVSGHEKKALSGATGASGGFLIPTQFHPVLHALQAEESIVRASGASVIRMTGRELKVPVLDQTKGVAGEPAWFGGIKFFWEGEGVEKTPSDAAFRQIALVAKKLYGLTHVGDELLNDSATSLEDFFSSPLGFAGGINFMEDYNFLRGPGGNRPQGMIGADATIAIPRTTAGTIVYADIIEMLSHALPSSNLTWVISQSLMSAIIQLSGPSGNASFIWQPDAREKIPGYLMGYPVRWTEKLPYKGTRGDILLMDSRYYLVGDRQQTLIESTKYARWVYDQTSWRVTHRVDGQPWLSQPITYMDGTTEVSPFVVLDSAGAT